MKVKKTKVAKKINDDKINNWGWEPKYIKHDIKNKE